MLASVLHEFPRHETTLLSVATSGLSPSDATQLAFGVDDDTTTAGSPKELEFEALDRSVDELRERYGSSIVTHGSDLLSGRTAFTEGLSEIMTHHDGTGDDPDDDAVS